MSSEGNIIPQVLCEFFEVTFHNILYRRGIYPKSIFIKTKAYGLPVFQSIQPEVNEYISEAIKAVLFYLKNKSLERLTLNVTVDGATVERYVIEMIEFSDSLVTDWYDSLERVFRKFLLKIESAVESLEVVPKNASFQICLYVTNYGVILFDKETRYSNFPWNIDKFEKDVSEIIPIHTYASEQIKLQLFVEKNTDFVFT